MLPYLEGDDKRPATACPVIVPQLLVGGTVKVAEDLSFFLRHSPNVLIATPGRLAELLSSPHVKTSASSFEVLILDEADRLLDMGFKDDLQRILGFLPQQRRTGLFSASVSEAVSEIVRAGLRHPHRVTVRVKGLKDGGIIEERKTPASLQMSYLLQPASTKFLALAQLLEKLEPRPSRSIVYLSTCFAVKYFHRVLPAILPDGFSLIPLHGKLEPNVREANFSKFLKSTTPTVLLTTDVAARGLDVPQVDFVCQIDPPQDPKAFVHRCGRAGRAGRRGLAVVMLQPGREEDYIPFLDIRKTPITLLEHPAVEILPGEADEAAAKIRQQALKDREIFESGTRAFVSFARSYQEHRAASIFRPGDLDWLDLAKGFGLLRLPKMPELKDKDFDQTLGLGVDTDAIPFKDKAKEKRRQAELAEQRAAREEGDFPGSRAAGRAAQKRKNAAWSGKHEREDVRDERRNKKRKKREAEKLASMTDREKEEKQKLDELIAQVRKRNEGGAAQTNGGGGDEFEGFGD